MCRNMCGNAFFAKGLTIPLFCCRLAPMESAEQVKQAETFENCVLINFAMDLYPKHVRPARKRASLVRALCYAFIFPWTCFKWEEEQTDDASCCAIYPAGDVARVHGAAQCVCLDCTLAPTRWVSLCRCRYCRALLGRPSSSSTQVLPTVAFVAICLLQSLAQSHTADAYCTLESANVLC